MHHVIPSFICQCVSLTDRVSGRQNSKAVPLDSWALICTHFLLVIQSNTNLGTLLKDFAKVIKILNQLTLKQEDFSRWAWPDHMSPLKLGLEIRDRESQRFNT